MWYAVLLGLLQGLTEFLPVSSSGHLALAQATIPGFEQPGVVFDATLHLGTAAAVVWFERRQLARWLGGVEGRRVLGALVVGTLATALLAFPLRRVATEAFVRVGWIGAALLVTGAVVLGSRRLAGGGADARSMRWLQAAAVGLVQGAAVFPGISRSAVTITTGLLVGLERRWAARFSFLLSVPAVLGASAIELASAVPAGSGLDGAFWWRCAVGSLVAAVTGLVALRIVLGTISSHVFHRFGWYCLPLGGLALAWSLWAG